MTAQDTGIAALSIDGELTIYRAAERKDEMLGALACVQRLELDLGAVTEMDASGVQLLLLLRREAASTGKQLVLTGSSQPAAEVMQLCGLDAAFAA